MPYYIPEHQELPLQFLAYKLNFLWPLSADSTSWQYALEKVGVAISLLFYVGTLGAEFAFMRDNMSNLPEMSECLSTSLMGLQYFVRVLMLAANSAQMRELLERFYAEIYYGNTVSEAPELQRSVTRMIPMILILVSFILEASAQPLSSPKKPYIYRMAFPWYDAQAPFLYCLTAVYTAWISYSTVSLMSSEDYRVSLMLCHMSYRFKALQLDLRNMLLSAYRVQRSGGLQLHQEFRRRLYKVMRRQQRLQSFVEQAKAHFTHQIFYSMTFGVLLLCIVMFKFQRTTISIAWVKYIIWVISQMCEFLMVGFFGQMLLDESLNLGHCYYDCHWEDLLPHGDQHINKLLMCDIQFAIMNSANPVGFYGMKLFSLTYNSIGKALLSAVSYFMFLNAMSYANGSSRSIASVGSTT